MAVEIGSKGLSEVNLTLPQNTSLTFDIVHKNDSGDVIDHSQSTARMAFQNAKTTYVLDSCCGCTAEYIRVSIPATMTKSMPLGKMSWDIIVTTSLGEQVRLCYGKVNIVDTYAFDEQV